MPPSSKIRAHDLDDKIYDELSDSQGIPKVYDSQSKKKMRLDFEEDDPYSKKNLENTKNDFNRVHNMSFNKNSQNGYSIKDVSMFTFEDDDKLDSAFEISCEQRNKPILIADPRHVNSKQKTLAKSKSSNQFTLYKSKSNFRKESIYEDCMRQSMNKSVLKDSDSTERTCQTKRKASFCNKKSEQLSKNLIK